ncbi:hypothetical protein [Daejeonella oryzae]|uniref:hypothetical protein n=1 Tax=Daejeonella oryzae TaxID=1122943 RepID=UPI00042A7585|nr:hypothetical protein [Daejeonella oryzae]
MNKDNFNSFYRSVGRTTCRIIFVLGIIYAITTTIGLLSLQSPDDSIGNPYFTIMEILSIVISLLMAISLITVHLCAPLIDKFFTLTALIFMCFTTVITSSVHFLILSVSHTMEAELLQNSSFFFSFKWPSVVYALDILAWDLFFGLSMLFLAPVFKIDKNLKALLIISGILSLIGLIGIPLQNMQIRNIGIIGYAVIGPVAFLLIGKILGGQKDELANKTNA